MADLDSIRFCEHAEALRDFAVRISTRGFAVYEHSYVASGWGNFHIIAGRADRRFRFVWEGRDADLDVEVKVVIRSRGEPGWRLIHTEPAAFAVREIFQLIEQYLVMNVS